MDYDGRSPEAAGQNINGQQSDSDLPCQADGSSAKSSSPPPEGLAVDADAPDCPDVVRFPGDQTVISKTPHLPSKENAAQPPPLDAKRLRPGDKLGHYELLKFVGGGGMGRVFRALDTKLDRHVAVKVLPCEQMADQETLQRFRNEAKSAARLDHDNIARAYDLGEDRGLSYLVFEFVEGDTIRDLVDRHGPMMLADALSYTLQVADALTHAAGRGITHRDVKPSNILITNEGRAKLIDMGLARIQTPHDSDDDLTATGVTLGTFDYISPEQARDPRIVDVRSDIYSLGCTFFYMLTGRPPFPEGTVLQKLLQHQGDEPPDIQDFRPEMPEEVSAILRKFLAKDPNRRYQTADELMEQLQHLAEQVGLRPLELSRRSWAASRPRRSTFFQRHLPWLAPVGALVLIWFCLHIYWSYTARLPLAEPQAASNQNDYPLDGSLFPPSATQLPPIDSTPKNDNKTPGGILKTDTPAHGPTPPQNDFENLLRGNGANSTKPQNSSPEVPWWNSNPFAPWPSASGPPGSDSILGGSNADDTAKTAKQPPSSPPLPGGKISAIAGEIRTSEPVASGLSTDDQSHASPSGISSATPAAALLSSGSPLATPNGSSAAAAAQLFPSLAGVRVVDGVGKLPNTYKTLRAACNDAKSRDIIELRYNGRQEQRPLALHNVMVTIRAGKQFRPVIVFRPNESDPSKYPRGMFNLTGTRLTLLDLAIELDIPKTIPAEQWSLFELGRTETLRLEGCSLTIRNAFDKPAAYREDVAFFRIQAAAADTPAAGAAEKNGSKKSAQIELLDCIVRGEAVLARTEKLQPLHLSWDNGLFVSSEQLLRTEGGQNSPPADDKIEIDLQHLTLVVNRGLCRMAGRRFASHQLPVSLNCTDSIVLCGNGQALVQQIGSSRPAEMRKLFTYSGDRNCYQGFDTFWSIENLESDVATELLEWEAWQSHWAQEHHENHSLWCRVDWQNPPDPSRLPHTCTQWDYMLDESEENPTRYSTSDGSAVGFDVQQLPALQPLSQGPEKTAR